jgi:hypothetical protein
MSKGGSFEGEVCKKLSMWVSNGIDGDIFWRADASGGRFTTHRKNGKNGILSQVGDITYRKDEGKTLIEMFCIEAKTGYAKKTTVKEGKRITNWCILDNLDSRQETPQFIQFWKQVEKNAKETNKHPILIFRRLNKNILISFPIDIFLKLKFNFLNNIITFIDNKHNINVVILKFDEFINSILYQDFSENCSH